MSELDQLQLIIKNILGNDNKARKESEGVLNQVKERNVDQYFLCLLELLKVSSDPTIRSFCAVMLRKQLSAFSEKNFTPSWYKISGQSATLMKTEIFIALTKEPEAAVRYQICDFIGELGGTILNIDEEEAKGVAQENKVWPELMQRVMELWMSKIDNMMESSLKIMTTLFTFVSDEFLSSKNDLHTIFKSGMEHDEVKIKVAAIEAMASWLEIIDSKHTKMYEDLVLTLMNTLLFILAKDTDKGQDVLGCIIDIAEAEPRFFKKNFNFLFQTMQKICSIQDTDEGSGIKQMALQVLICMVERIPKIFKENQQLLRDFLEMIFAYMISTTEDVTPEWQQPKEGYLEELADEDDDADNAGVKFGRHAIDRLISCIGEKIMLAMLSNLVQQMLTNNDWRFKFCALMALSQVGEYVENVDEIAPIVGLVLKYLSDEHPKIRFAACHVIGQISDDCQPEFQVKFHSEVLQHLLNGLKENVPRVLSHVLAALTNFVEGLTPEIVNGYLETILNLVFPFVQQGISIVRENALSAVAAAAESAREHYRPYFERSVPIVYEIMKTHTQKEYKQLRGQCIECITLMGFSVGKEYFMKYASEIIKLLVEIQQSDVALDGSDPQRCYVLSGWQRICLILEEDFVPYLSIILPSLFKMIEHIFKGQSEVKPEESDFAGVNYYVGDNKDKLNDKIKDLQKANINTFEHEEAEIAINMIYVFIDELKKGYFEFVAPTTELVLRAVNYSLSDKIRRNAAKCLPALLEVIKDSSHPGKNEILYKLAPTFMDSLWTAISTEFEAETILHQIHAIKDIIDLCGKFMNQSEIEAISTRILKVLSESDLRKSANEDYKKESECEEEELDVIADDNDQEEELHVGLAELIGILFKTHKELTLPLVQVLYNDVLTKVLQPGLSDKMYKFGLFLIDDMIEFLGIELIPNEWPYLSEALLRFATNKTCFVRQAALYGIGMLALKSKEVFGMMADLCIQKVLEALKIAKGSESDRIYGFARDNAVSALGKIIQSHPDKVSNAQEILKVWLEFLPMTYDKPEGRRQHELLVDTILGGNATMILGQNGENLPKVIKIFAVIIDTKMSDDKIKGKISTFLKALFRDEATKSLLENSLKQLTELQRQRVENTLNM